MDEVTTVMTGTVDYALSTIVVFFEAFCTIVLFNGYLERRFRKLPLSNSLFLSLYLTVLWVGVMVLSTYVAIGVWQYLLILGAKLIIAIAFYRNCRMGPKILISAFTTVISIAISACVLYIYQAFVPVSLTTLQQEDTHLHFLLGSISQAILLVFCIVWLKLFRKNPLNDEISLGSAWFLLLVTPLVTAISIYSITVVFDPNSSSSMLLLISAIGLLILNVIVFYLFDTTIERESEQRKRVLLSQQGDLELKSTKAYITYLDGKKSLVHDYIKHMGMLRRLLHNSQYEQARQYSEDYYPDIQNVAFHVFSGNLIIDAVIGQMMDRCRPLDVDFILHVPPIKRMPVSDKMIVSILNNALDNALEAAVKVKGKRTVVLKILEESENFFVSVINSAMGKVKIVNNTVKTTKLDKELHGYGLKIANNAVESCGGVLELFSTETSFQFTAMLPYKQYQQS